MSAQAPKAPFIPPGANRVADLIRDRKRLANVIRCGMMTDTEALAAADRVWIACEPLDAQGQRESAAYGRLAGAVIATLLAVAEEPEPVKAKQIAIDALASLKKGLDKHDKLHGRLRS